MNNQKADIAKDFEQLYMDARALYPNINEAVDTLKLISDQEHSLVAYQLLTFEMSDVISNNQVSFS